MAVRISRPAQVEQLKLIEHHGNIDYQTLRGFFPLRIDDFENQLNELVHLELVKKEKIDNENVYTITEEGKRANKLGLSEFVKRMVIKEAELFLYPRLNKSTTLLEENAVRQLENSGKIFFNGKGYKVVPSKEYEEPENNEPHKISRLKKIKTSFFNFFNNDWVKGIGIAITSIYYTAYFHPINNFIGGLFDKLKSLFTIL